jgi:putative ABC transport system ATP-binding protein
MTILEARHLTKTYTVDRRRIKVLDDVSLKVAAGEFMVITGASGSGKTTLLTLLSGLDHPSSGNVLIDNRDITGATEDELAPMRNKLIGFVFQSFHLVPSMTARENVMFPAELLGDPEASRKAERLLERMGLADRGDNLPSQLSGGEKQRVALCRSMINQPKLLFADEPTGNLDTKSGMAVLSQLVALKNERGATLVMVTHNPDIAKAADRLLVIKDGCLADRT